MGWTDSHLHQFRVGDVVYGEPDRELEPGPVDDRRVTLNQIAPRATSACIYEYDFGDGWEHLIEVEDEVPAAETGGVIPRCLDGERACPPEDCGGAPGYQEILLALADATHPEHDEWREWTGPTFDPAAFDLEGVNQALRRFSPRATPRAPKGRARGGRSR